MTGSVWRYGVTGMAAAAALLSAPAIPAAELQWYRCNTHTHTSAPEKSDANGTPEDVAEWYRAHGYQCLFITDHEHLTDVTPINKKYPPDTNFLVIQGQEITQMMEDPAHPDGVRHFHINGLGINSGIKPVGYPQKAKDTAPLALYTRNMAEIRAAGGLPQINHPNLAWSVSAGDVPRGTGPFLLELWNAAPASNNLGGFEADGQRRPSPEELWDQLLSSGETVWGVGSDDAHEYQKFDDQFTSTPGRAWVVVRAPSLTAPAILKALREGQFYASTGVSLDAYSADDTSISLTISPRASWTSKRKPNARYTTRFIGENGKVLAEVYGLNAGYRFKGGERYVRAFIVDSDGKRAWTQPVFRRPK